MQLSTTRPSSTHLNTDHIRTTHTGSLPRPDDLVELLYAEELGETADHDALNQRIHEAVGEIVDRQRAAGVDIVNDGEVGKFGYATYVTRRLTGYDERIHVPRAPRRDAALFPGWAAWEDAQQQSRPHAILRYACTGPVSYVGRADLQRELDNLTSATEAAGVAEAFMTAASPGIIAFYQPNRYYDSEEEYLFALAGAMREEYEAIVAAGFTLQLDCPDLTGVTHDLDADGKPGGLTTRIEAINHAVANIPPERMRLHLCWGNYEGPHLQDVSFREIVGEVLKARPAMLSFEGANPRHAHEWTVFEDVKLPDGKVVIPGVLDSTTNFVEHPELVAQRILSYARLVGRERVIAGSDCGFGTFAGMPKVHPEIVFAKLAAMTEGARIASEALWS
jgi:5-methyltetrahydropteroyltriglutamate--homocysteine methyltransferase